MSKSKRIRPMEWRLISIKEYEPWTVAAVEFLTQDSTEAEADDEYTEDAEDDRIVGNRWRRRPKISSLVKISSPHVPAIVLPNGLSVVEDDVRVSSLRPIMVVDK